MNEVQRFFVEDTRLGIPVDFTNEGIRGVESYRATNFPTQLGLGHTWNRDLIYKVGRITGREGRMLGYTNVYAPILDVGRDQRWGRYEEVYGESPYLVAELGIEMVKGMQYNHQVAATGKHFIAYSNNKGAREGMARVDPQMSPREVEMVHVYPFRRVIKEAGLLGVMSSYNDYDGFPIQSSSYWLTTRLRGEWGFRGYVVSDVDAVVEYGMNGVWSETGNSKGDAISASTEMQDVGMTLDNDLKTCWQGNKGDYITFALENGAKIDGLSIAWKKENTGEADFEIQLSGGGGQFLTVYSGSVSKFNEWMSYTFKGTTASDLRILLNSDGLGVAEVKINQLKKE